MKKTKILILSAITALAFSGCSGGSKSGNFKEYNFKEDLSDAEMYSVLVQAKDKLNDISVIEQTTNSTYNSKYHVAKGEEKETTTIFSNRGMKAEIKYQNTETNDNVTYKESWTQNALMFYEPTSKLAVSKSEHSLNGTSFQFMAFQEGKEEEQFDYMMNTTLYSVLSGHFTQQGLQAYKQGKNYSFLTSSVQETRNPIMEGFSIRYEISIHREQSVMEINDKFEVTSYRVFTDFQYNRDPQTGEWNSGDKVKTVETNEIKLNFKYGNKKAGDYSAVTANLNSGYIADHHINATPFGFDKPAEEWVATPYADLDPIAQEWKMDSEKTAHYKGAFFFENEIPSQRYGIQLRVSAHAAKSLTDETGYAFSQDIAVPVDGAETVSAETYSRYMFAQQYGYTTTVYVEFDLNYIGGEKGVEIANAVVKLLPPLPEQP